MKPVSLFSLVFLVLLVDVQGIRLEQGFFSVVLKRIHEVENRLIEVEASVSGGVFGDVVLCRDGQCSGRNRKLMSNSPSSTTTTTKTRTNIEPTSSIEGFDKNKERLSVKSSPVSEHREGVTEHYPDIVDIAGMDYSPAKRKPPIHN